MTIEALEARVAHVEGTVGQMDGRLTAIESRLTDLDKKLDARIGDLDKKLDTVAGALRTENGALSAKIDTSFRWMVGLIVGTMGLGFVGIVVTIAVSS